MVQIFFARGSNIDVDVAALSLVLQQHAGLFAGVGIGIAAVLMFHWSSSGVQFFLLALCSLFSDFAAASLLALQQCAALC